MGITHQFSATHTPQQNGVVERRNRTLVEAARTMLAYSKLPPSLWAEAISTACFRQNRSLINKRFEKTPYEVINKRKPNVNFLHIFGCVCYVLNDRENLGKFDPKGEEGYFVGYSRDSIAYKVYNRRNRRIFESMNVRFDEISGMVLEHRSSRPDPHCPQPSAPKTASVFNPTFPTPTTDDLDILFDEIYRESPVVTESENVPTTPSTSNVEETTPTQQDDVHSSSNVSSSQDDSSFFPPNDSTSQAPPIQISQVTSPSTNPLDYDDEEFVERIETPLENVIENLHPQFVDLDEDSEPSDPLPHQNK